MESARSESWAYDECISGITVHVHYICLVHAARELRETLKQCHFFSQFLNQSKYHKSGTNKKKMTLLSRSTSSQALNLNITWC